MVRDLLLMAEKQPEALNAACEAAGYAFACGVLRAVVELLGDADRLREINRAVERAEGEG